MSDVIQFNGTIEAILKTLRSRRFRKQLISAFGRNKKLRIRIERIDEYDEQIYG